MERKERSSAVEYPGKADMMSADYCGGEEYLLDGVRDI